MVLTNVEKINAIHEMLTTEIKGEVLKELKSKHLDIRLSFEFFKGGKTVQTIGVTPYNSMFIDHTLYTYDKQELKCMDEYIEGLSKILGIK